STGNANWALKRRGSPSHQSRLGFAAGTLSRQAGSVLLVSKVKRHMQLRRVVRFMLFAALCVPLAFGLTVASWPLWGWFEAATGIESLGHSGPASWCYLFTYVALIAISNIFGVVADRRHAE
ncbi:MAG: hypothetical protein D3M94_18015, partial [Rhodocyclales bacterium GT-UBC]